MIYLERFNRTDRGMYNGLNLEKEIRFNNPVTRKPTRYITDAGYNPKSKFPISESRLNINIYIFFIKITISH